MRILMVNDYAIEQLGGAEKYVYSLASLLREHGHEVEIFGKEVMPGRAVTITRVYNPVWSYRVSRRIEEFKPHIMHAHHVSYVLSPSVMLAAKQHSVPVVLSAHDFHLLCPRTSFIHSNGKLCEYGFGLKCLSSGCALRPYEMYVYAKLMLHRRIISRGVSCIISPSEVLATWIRRNMGISDVRVVPHFIIPSASPARPVPGSRKILFVGRFVPEKGASTLIEAMPHILKEVPEAELVMAGAGEQAGLLKHQCRELGIGERVTFTGWKTEEELSILHDQAQLVCFPSIGMESFGLVLLEAIEHRRPIIASAAGAVPEIINDGSTGFLFEPGNPEDLAAKAVVMLKDHALCRSIAERLGELGDIYSREKHILRMNEIYESVAKEVPG